MSAYIGPHCALAPRTYLVTESGGAEQLPKTQAPRCWFPLAYHPLHPAIEIKSRLATPD